MQQVLSSTHAVNATAQVWASMVDLVDANRLKAGRGCVFYDEGADRLEYYALRDLQSIGDLSPDVHRDLRQLINSGYKFHSEFVLLVKQSNGGTIKYIAQTGDLRYDGWKDVKSPQEIKAQERNGQLAVARQLKMILEGRRSGNKSSKKRRRV